MEPVQAFKYQNTDFKKAYLKPKESSCKEVTILETKKPGHPKLLLEEIIKKTIQTIKFLWIKCALIGNNVVNAIAKGIVFANDRAMLVKHGGHLIFTVNSSRNVLNVITQSERQMVRRMATASKISIVLGLLREEQFIFQWKTQAFIKWHNIPKDLVLNLDRTPRSYITVGNCTLEFKRAKSVPVKGKRKGKLITGTLKVTSTGHFLRMQLIYAGKTTNCHPQSNVFPQGFNITHWDNHWGNEDLDIQQAHEVILPYVNKVKKELGYPKSRRVSWFTMCLRDKLPKDFIIHKCIPPIWPTSFNLLILTSTKLLKVFLKVTFKHGTQTKSQNRWMKEKGFMKQMWKINCSEWSPYMHVGLLV